MADRVIRKAVRKALLAAPLQSRLSRCVDADVGFGGGTVGPTPRAQPAVLLLEMETFESEVRIGQAQVQTWGGASEQTVSCAREVLSGQVIRTSGIEGGQRLRMPFPLNPRIALVDASR